MTIRARRRPSADVSELAWSMLNDEPVLHGGWEGYSYEWWPDTGPPGGAYGSLREAWAACRDEILPRWIRDRPGTRPSAWWRWDSPEPVIGVQFGDVPTEPEQTEVLRRLGLMGRAEIEALAG